MHDLDEVLLLAVVALNSVGTADAIAADWDDLGGGDTDPHRVGSVKPCQSVMIFQYPACFGTELAPTPASPRTSVSTSR